jgi:hypothetical protein
MPATRWLVALGCAALLLAGCARQEGSAVIGVPPQPDISPASPAPFDPSSIEVGLAQQLADSTASLPVIQEQALAAGQLPIDTLLSARQQERWAVFVSTGLAQVDQRLAALASTRSRVLSDPLVSYYQKATITSLLDSARARVIQMQAKIGNDQLVDQTRVDVRNLAKLYIFGLVLPQAKLMLAAYQLSQLGYIYANQVANPQHGLQQQVNNAQSLGCDITTAQAYVNDLSAQSAALRYDGNIMLGDVQSLNAAGYPGNKYLLKSAHGPQNAGKNANIRANADGSRIRAEIAALHRLGC